MNSYTEKKTNFYYKMPLSEFEAVEVYVGQSSGKQLQLDIENAKNEVLIISPYIDETKLDDLIKLKNRSINVRLAFSSLRKEQEKDILKKLIHQNKYTDSNKKVEVKKNIELYNYMTISFLVVGIFALLFSVFKIIDSKSINYYFLLSIPFFYLFNLSKRKKKKIEETQIYKYDYSEKINFKFLRSSFGEKKFIHSKIYIVDRKVAYLGSINYTNNGFFSNFETRIRITHKEKIKELVEFVHNIFDDNDNFNKHELNWLGQKVYSEEKY